MEAAHHGTVFAFPRSVDIFGAGTMVALFVVFGAWGAWLGQRTGARRTWGAVTWVAIALGAITTILAAVRVLPDVPMADIARGVAYVWALMVAIGTLIHAYRRDDADPAL